MRWQDFIERRADVLLGKPIIAGTRIAVGQILERLGDGWSETDLLDAHPQLRAEHIRAAQSYAAAALASDELILVDA